MHYSDNAANSRALVLLKCQADIFLSIKTPNVLHPFKLVVLQVKA